MEPKNELQRNAIALARRKELESFQRALDIQWLNSRMEDGRMGRCLALIQREAEMEKDFQERTDHAAIVNARAAKETDLGIEVAKIKREEACELLRRHYLRERDPSLREFARKLQAGYVCRDLKQQILHNEYRRLQDKLETDRCNAALNNAVFTEHEARENEEKEKMETSSQYRRELQQQLVNKQRQKQCQYEDRLIEKKMLDDIMRTISDEDNRELQQKQEQMVKMRNEMVTFKKAREAWKVKQQKMVVLEELEIEKQQQAAADRSASIIAERQRKMDMKEALNQKICAKILADEEARLDRENIIKQLQEQEFLEKNFQDDIAQREKTERVRRETLQSLTSQMDRRKQLAEEQKAFDLEFRKQAEAKRVADDEREREKERDRRAKSRHYFRELQQQIEQNALRRHAEGEEERRRAAHVWDCDSAWRSEVSDERRKMVSEHAPAVLGHLQAGVLQREDLPQLAQLQPPPGADHPKCNQQCQILRRY